MERKDFLKGAGLFGLGAFLPLKKTLSSVVEETTEQVSSCTLIPTETRGPYPLPSTSTVSAITRSDIRESKTGVLLTLTVTVQNQDCTVIPGARVDIWQCDKDGYYSAYDNQPGYLGTQNNAGTTWLRGSQTTDANGQVTFTTIYPGWYTGRVTHIHAEVYIGGVLQRTSQFAFPDNLNTTVYTTSSFYTPHGTNTITNSTDNVFSDGYTSQLLNISGSVVNGFTATHLFTINYTITPVTLIDFSAAWDARDVRLWWDTADEINLSAFGVERSINGVVFDAIGDVKAQNNITYNSYTFIDNTMPASASKLWYRLKMTDKDGSFRYSSIVLLTAKQVSGLAIYPNPATTSITVKHPQVRQGAKLLVLTVDGRQLASGVLTAGATVSTVNVEQLSKGNYLLVIENGGNREVTKFTKL